MDYCGECASELTNKDATFCMDLGYKQPVGTTSAGTTTVGNILHPVSPQSTSDVSSPEMERKVKGIITALFAAGLFIVAIGMMMAVASIIFMFVSGM